jgi:hypothetical protein
VDWKAHLSLSFPRLPPWSRSRRCRVCCMISESAALTELLTIEEIGMPVASWAFLSACSTSSVGRNEIEFIVLPFGFFFGCSSLCGVICKQKL